jgi:hypothetical protein
MLSLEKERFVKAPKQSSVGALARATPQPSFSMQAEAVYPLKLTPQHPFLLKVAALVFVGGMISPADNSAEFYGWTEDSEEPGPLGIPQEVVVGIGEPPPDLSGVTTWFQPTEINREYLVQFDCRGSCRGSFWLMGEGTEEVVDVNVKKQGDAESQSVSATFSPQEERWFSFRITSDAIWSFMSSEIFQLS